MKVEKIPNSDRIAELWAKIKNKMDSLNERVAALERQVKALTGIWWSPKMTSNTTPPPYVVASSSVYQDYAPYRAFNNKNELNSTSDCASLGIDDPDPWISFDFGGKKVVYGIRFKPRNYPGGTAATFPKTIYVDVSDDGQTWKTIEKRNNIPQKPNPEIWAITMVFDNPVTTRFVRFSHLNEDGYWYPIGNGGYITIGEIEFLLPTSNTETASINEFTINTFSTDEFAPMPVTT